MIKKADYEVIIVVDVFMMNFNMFINVKNIEVNS